MTDPHPLSPNEMAEPAATALADSQAVVLASMRRWLEQAVIGLNLCPFAKSVYAKNQIHWVVTDASSHAELLDVLRSELLALQAIDAARRDTTLIIVPNGLGDFLVFNDLLRSADRLLRKLRLDGVFQIASFHPDFEFADAAAQDITHNTNRAPYPTLHLLRETSVARAVQAFPEAEMIFDKNRQTLTAIGQAGWDALHIGPGAT